MNWKELKSQKGPWSESKASENEGETETDTTGIMTEETDRKERNPNRVQENTSYMTINNVRTTTTSQKTIVVR